MRNGKSGEVSYWFGFKKQKEWGKAALTVLVTSELQANRGITVDISSLRRREESPGKIHLSYLSLAKTSTKSLWKSLYKLIHIVTSFSKALHYTETKMTEVFISEYWKSLIITTFSNPFYFAFLFLLKVILSFFNLHWLYHIILTKGFLSLGEAFVNLMISSISVAIPYSPSEPARTARH